MGTRDGFARCGLKPAIWEVNFLAMDDEAFKIIDGPIAKDGYTWWHCEALLDKTRSGWAAEDYLQVLELSTPQP
jgi:hypothetical protein